MIKQDAVRSRSAESLVGLVFVSLLLIFPAALAQDNNPCDQPGEAPDVIIDSLYETKKWGTVGDITSFSVGTYACNIGTCWAVWYPNTNQHPVISGNIFRLKDGKYEQIGQSWLKHGFFALSGDLCSSECIPTDGQHLGVNCADPYSASLNGEQDRLGPKFEVDPSTGYFPYPATDMSLQGDAIFKRIQVYNDDLDPLLNPGASYFIESQYITPDEPPAGTHYNNSSYRPINVSGSSGVYNISVTGQTEPGSPAIMAWVNNDPEVDLTVIDVPSDGRLFLAARATALGGGMWNYEYAIQNQNSSRAVGEFRMPILPDANLVNLGFHDVDYHSGEPFDGTDWRTVIDDGTIPNTLIWKTDSHTVNPDANALRWDTLYNFRFDADMPPRSGPATLAMFLPGVPAEITTTTIIPRLCNENGTCDVGEDVCDCLTDCVPTANELVCTDGVDEDCDGDVDCWDADCCTGSDCDNFDPDEDFVAICDDCLENDGTVWSMPGEVRNVVWRDQFGQLALAWSRPLAPGGKSLEYGVLRSEDPTNFMIDVACLVSAIPTVLWYVDGDVPAEGSVFYYLVRGKNACPGSLAWGDVGTDWQGTPRQAIRCP